MILRTYQEAATNAAIEAIKSGIRCPVICAATGTGKSLIIASLIKRLKTSNPKMCVMQASHVATLLKQNAEKLAQLMPLADVGFYSAELGRKDLGNAILFAGIQSIFRVTADDLGEYHVLIVDEAHTIGRKEKTMWHALINTLKSLYPNLIIIGLSATPFRMDSGSLTSGDDALFDEIVFDYGLSHAVQDGYLCKLVGKGTATKYDVSKVGKLGGEFNLKELEAATNLDHLTVQAVKESIQFGLNRKSWLAFCNGVQHSFSIRDEFRRNGVSCETVTGETPPDQRDNILQAFKSGIVKCVTNNAVWTTGVDIPNVDMILMFRHTLSSSLLLQMAGRGTRVTIDLSPYITRKERLDAIAASNKPNCLFIDFAGNIERHGFLDEIKATEKKKKGDGVAPMKICPSCATICHAAARKCPDCAHQFPKNELQIIGAAHEGAVMSQPKQWRDVMAVTYSGHNMRKEGKTPCLMVTYLHSDDTITREYVCLQHHGFAKKKADAWWKRHDGCHNEGATIEMIVESGACDTLKKPSRILVGKEGKYDRVYDYDFRAAAPKAEVEHFDIEF